MFVAVIHNISHANVINRLGMPNREMYYRDEIDAVLDALAAHNHVVRDFDGDCRLLQNLERFLPRVRAGERPEGLVLNLSYGIQGNCRYTHVPAILEMAGVPYTGSSPLAHGIALDKEMTKRILLHAGIATPRYVLLTDRINRNEARRLALTYPLIIKPENEAASFGISVVNCPEELVVAAAETLDEFKQPLLVEEFLEGREFNVGVLGNGDELEVFAPVEIDFLGSGERFQSSAGKKNNGYRHLCPADISVSLQNTLQDLARRTFAVLKCYDYARVDFRLDRSGRPHVLEINSMAAIHRRGSFFAAARQAGYDYPGLLNRMVEVAGDRYHHPHGVTQWRLSKKGPQASRTKVAG